MSKTRGRRSQAQPKTRVSPLTAAPGQQSLIDLAIWLGLILSIFVVYAQAGRFDFTDYDDGDFVYDNVHVQAGLTPGSIKWAFTAVVSANWAPVTMLSHILDCQFFGMQSGMHHLVNVVFHALSAVLLFMALQRATRARWPSAFVALVFALHPLHVESVAWVAERKDVLSAFFCFLGLYCYVRYAERPGLGSYLAVLVSFALGLMSKPMLVTFPFALLLFDIWPLRRVQLPKILWEKLPLIALSAAVSAVTYLVQRAAGSVQGTPLELKIGNALISYVTYIGQTFWPVRLAVFYPYAQSIAAWRAAVALGIILGVSALAILARRTRPYLAVGWLWYLGTLVPVIGLVQVGQQSHADRYTYIPMVGLSMMAAWGAADIVKEWPRAKFAMAGAATAFCIVWMALAREQAAYWQNSETLYQHAIDVTENNWAAQYYLGQYLMKMPGHCADVIEHLGAALRVKPDLPEAESNLGACLVQFGVCKAAIPHLQAALRAAPGSVEASNNLGVCAMRTAQYADALSYFETALRARPDDANLHFNLGRALAKIPGRTLEAIAQYEAVLRVRHDYQNVHHNLGELFMSLGRTDEAIAHFEAEQRIRPDPEISKTIDRLRAGQK